MVFLQAQDFRSDSLHEACSDLALSDDDATSASLTAAIVRLSARLEGWTNDSYEPTTGAITVGGEGGSRLMLPNRTTAVTEVKTRDEFGTLSTALNAQAYRLRSSLNALGTERVNTDDLDWLELVYGGYGRTSYVGDPYAWPIGAGAVQVTGTFGWAAVPGDIKRALALIVYDHFKTKRADLRMAEQVSGGDVIVRYTRPDPASNIWTGIHDADLIISEFRRDLAVGVG